MSVLTKPFQGASSLLIEACLSQMLHKVLNLSQLHHASVYDIILTFITQISLPFGRKNSRPEVQSLFILHHTMCQKFSLAQKHTVTLHYSCTYFLVFKI